MSRLSKLSLVPHLSSTETLDLNHFSKKDLTVCSTSSCAVASVPSSLRAQVSSSYSLDALNMLLSTFPFPFPSPWSKLSLLAFIAACTFSLTLFSLSLVSWYFISPTWSTSLCPTSSLAYPWSHCSHRPCILSICIPVGMSECGHFAPSSASRSLSLSGIVLIFFKAQHALFILLHHASSLWPHPSLYSVVAAHLGYCCCTLFAIVPSMASCRAVIIAAPLASSPLPPCSPASMASWNFLFISSLSSSVTPFFACSVVTVWGSHKGAVPLAIPAQSMPMSVIIGLWSLPTPCRGSLGIPARMCGLPAAWPLTQIWSIRRFASVSAFFPCGFRVCARCRGCASRNESLTLRFPSIHVISAASLSLSHMPASCLSVSSADHFAALRSPARTTVPVLCRARNFAARSFTVFHMAADSALLPPVLSAYPYTANSAIRASGAPFSVTWPMPPAPPSPSGPGSRARGPAALNSTCTALAGLCPIPFI